MVGREMFDSQTQLPGDWRSGGPGNINEGPLSKRGFVR